MKNNKMMKRTIALICAVMLAAAPALANTSKKGEADTEPAVIVEVQATPVPAPPVLTEPVVVTTSVPFSVVGNGEVLDDIKDGSKEFYTITTENNNTFFLVVDKASTSQNVYMLAKVDENDVAEFIEGGLPTPAPTQEPQPTVIIQQPTPAPAEPVVQTEPVEDDSNTGSYAVIAIMALAALGGLIYFKVYKPKKENAYDDNEGMEYDDSEDEHTDE